jgi:hypothetical protein
MPQYGAFAASTHSQFCAGAGAGDAINTSTPRIDEANIVFLTYMSDLCVMWARTIPRPASPFDCLTPGSKCRAQYQCVMRHPAEKL